jgi:hypothetical protein
LVDNGKSHLSWKVLPMNMRKIIDMKIIDMKIMENPSEKHRPPRWRKCGRTKQLYVV